jgi:hypothetical protein
MSRLQVGGLALTLGSKISPNNIGLTVELTEFYPNRYCDGVDWFLVNNSELLGANLKRIGYGYFPVNKLLPLGDEQTQEQLRQELEQAVKRDLYETTD